MATAPKQNLGKMPCPDCGGAVAVHRSLPGTLSYKCQEADCESSGFAASHTGAAKKWLTKLGAGVITVSPISAKKQPEIVPGKSAFSMGAL